VNAMGGPEIERDQRELNAYHDGELKGLRRWRFERRLSRSPRLRAELEALQQLGRWLQGLGEEATGLDVWDQIALRLPAIDAERAERGAAPRSEWRRMDWLADYARPLTALALGAALALALFLGIMKETPPPTAGIIRWMDTGGRSVMVLEDQGEATIVWLLDAPEDGTSQGGSREAV